MHYNFCTLFDKNYLTRGLALYGSLQQHAGDFTLWILCMDDVVFDILSKLHLDHVMLVRLADFEDPELLKIKPTRSPVEYCWTLTPSWPLFLLRNHPELGHITYLDADTFFYSSPKPIYDEYAGHSILIVSHNYAKRFAYKAPLSGIYNVEYLTFRNDAAGLACLQWWRERCNEWCYFRFEDGKLGDQMYLDDWPTRFKGVKVLENLGGGVAPWNIERFKFSLRDQSVYINDLPVIFFHYHAFKLFNRTQYDPLIGYYYCPKIVRQLIYTTYCKALNTALDTVQTITPQFADGFTTSTPMQRFRRSCILFMMNHQPVLSLYSVWKN